jgi:hypothetical protein
MGTHNNHPRRKSDPRLVVDPITKPTRWPKADPREPNRLRKRRKRKKKRFSIENDARQVDEGIARIGRPGPNNLKKENEQNNRVGQKNNPQKRCQYPCPHPFM